MVFINLVKDPVFFDIFGIAIFAFLLYVGIWSLKSKQKLPKWVSIVILIIGVLGLLVDGYFVISNYLL